MITKSDVVGVAIVAGLVAFIGGFAFGGYITKNAVKPVYVQPTSYSYVNSNGDTMQAWNLVTNYGRNFALLETKDGQLVDIDNVLVGDEILIHSRSNENIKDLTNKVNEIKDALGTK